MNLRSRPRARRRASAGQVALVACLLSTLVNLPTASRHVAASAAQLDASSVGEAVRIGRSSEAERARFHAAYHVAVDDPVIRGIDVVTGFRRLVQLTEERVRLRDASWDASRAAVASRDFEGRVDFVVSLQFSPLNSYREVPAYALAIYPPTGGVVRPLDERRAAFYVNSQPAPPGTPILSATITATFDATRLDWSSPCIVGVFLDGKEVRRVPLDLSTLR